MDNGPSKEAYFQGMDGRWYHTREEVIAANNEYMQTKQHTDAEKMTEFTSATGCQIWFCILVICLTIAFPPLWIIWFGLACLFFGRRR